MIENFFVIFGLIALLLRTDKFGNILQPQSLISNYLTPFKKMSVSDQDIYKEGMLETTKLINLYEYPAENHTVTTRDGYILTMHRIPYGKQNKTSTQMPIFLQHGFLTKSEIWVNNMDNSIGFKLADQGFDVWLGNTRGNEYSRQHKSLSINSEEFWHYGWDKFVKYDIPDMIDYIRNHTKRDKILTVGHSMGALSLFCASASQPEFNQKILGTVALGPIAHPRYSPSFLFFYKKLIVKHRKIIKSIFNKSFYSHYGKSEDLLQRLLQTVPFPFVRLPFDSLTGFNPDSHKNKTRFPIHINTGIAGTSSHIFYHLNEMTSNATIVGYNYGKHKNLREYNQTRPIEYDFRKVQIPVAIMHFPNDALSSSVDVALMMRKLPNLIASEMLDNQLASHLDYFFLDEGELIIKTMLHWLEQMQRM